MVRRITETSQPISRSRGTTLGLGYLQAHPASCKAAILRGISVGSHARKMQWMSALGMGSKSYLVDFLTDTAENVDSAETCRMVRLVAQVRRMLMNQSGLLWKASCLPRSGLMCSWLTCDATLRPTRV